MINCRNLAAGYARYHRAAVPSLSRQLQRSATSCVPTPTVCISPRPQEQLQLPDLQFTTLCDAFGVELLDAQTAGGDARALARLLRGLEEWMAEQPALYERLEANSHVKGIHPAPLATLLPPAAPSGALPPSMTPAGHCSPASPAKKAPQAPPFASSPAAPAPRLGRDCGASVASPQPRASPLRSASPQPLQSDAFDMWMPIPPSVGAVPAVAQIATPAVADMRAQLCSAGPGSLGSVGSFDDGASSPGGKSPAGGSPRLQLLPGFSAAAAESAMHTAPYSPSGASCSSSGGGRSPSVGRPPRPPLSPGYAAGAGVPSPPSAAAPGRRPAARCASPLGRESWRGPQDAPHTGGGTAHTHEHWQAASDGDGAVADGKVEWRGFGAHAHAVSPAAPSTGSAPAYRHSDGGAATASGLHRDSNHGANAFHSASEGGAAAVTPPLRSRSAGGWAELTPPPTASPGGTLAMPGGSGRHSAGGPPAERQEEDPRDELQGGRNLSGDFQAAAAAAAGPMHQQLQRRSSAVAARQPSAPAAAPSPTPSAVAPAPLTKWSFLALLDACDPGDCIELAEPYSYNGAWFAGVQRRVAGRVLPCHLALRDVRIAAGIDPAAVWHKDGGKPQLKLQLGCGEGFGVLGRLLDSLVQLDAQALPGFSAAQATVSCVPDGRMLKVRGTRLVDPRCPWVSLARCASDICSRCITTVYSWFSATRARYGTVFGILLLPTVPPTSSTAHHLESCAQRYFQLQWLLRIAIHYPSISHVSVATLLVSAACTRRLACRRPAAATGLPSGGWWPVRSCSAPPSAPMLPALLRLGKTRCRQVRLYRISEIIACRHRP